MTTQSALADAFKERQRFFAHRSSAIFPLLIDQDADLHIVFLNYWKLKNSINSVGVNFRVYDSDGSQIERIGIEAIDEHNSISVRKDILKSLSDLPFFGMVEVEIVSNSNLKFTFPAVIGIYESKGHFSCVHSAGRIKNADELKTPSSSEETNWTCKFVKRTDTWTVIPFFHYFVGAIPLPEETNIEAVLRSPYGETIETAMVPVGNMGPFSSKIFYADEIFDLVSCPPPRDSFISVRLLAHDVFPRLVVGNFHRDLQFLEVTHSFPLTEIEDYCLTSQGDQDRPSFNSMLTAQTSQALNLRVHIFPTNCEGEVSATVRRKSFGDQKLVDHGERLTFRTEPGNSTLSFSLEDREEMRVMGLSGAKVPSRLNASFRYSVSGPRSIFSTDIATGAKSNVYPPKFHHWGHGCIGGDFNTHIMFHNNSHVPAKTQANQGTLRILGPDIDVTIPVRVAEESCLTVDVAKELGLDSLLGDPIFVSWYLSMENPVGEAFWVAFRDDGAIFGEHAF